MKKLTSVGKWLQLLAIGATVATCSAANQAAAPAGQSADAFKPAREFVATDGDVEKVVFTPDDKTVIGSGPYAVHIWRIDTGQLVRIRTVAYPDNTVQDLKIDASGKTLAYLVAGLQNEVVFVDVATGRRIDIRTGAVLTNEIAAGKPGEGSWQLPRGQDALTIPTGVALQSVKGGAVPRVAVGYSSGTVQLLNVQTGTVTEFQTTSNELRTVEFDTEGRLLWTNPEGYGRQSGANRLTIEKFPNSHASFTNNHLWMFSVANEKPVVRSYDAAANTFRNSYWQAVSEPVMELKPFANGRLLAMYETGNFGVHNLEGQPFGKPFALMSGVKEASDIPPTTMAISESGSIAATMRGPVISVFELSKLVK